MKGGPELMAFLDQLPTRLAVSAVRGGMNAAAKVIRDEARALVPRKSGLTRKSIGHSTRVQGLLVTAKVRTRGAHAFLAPMLEYGTRSHWIRLAEDLLPKTRRRDGRVKTLSIRTANKMIRRGSLVINGNFVGDSVFHPGARAHPFMRPALDIKGVEAINAMGAYIANRLKFGNLQAPQLTAEDDDE